MRLFRKKTASAQPRRIPTHIAIVMDGNGRWAKQRGLPRPAGHKAGAESFRTIANYAKSIGLQYLTVYAFSTENWKRRRTRWTPLWTCWRNTSVRQSATWTATVFDSAFSATCRACRRSCSARRREAVERSKKYEGVQVNFCLNYGGRDEIVRAAQRFAAPVRRPESTARRS